MKNLNYLNDYRVEFMGMMGDEHNGAFMIKIKGEGFYIIASDGGGWDHVSISPVKAHKTPSWTIMCLVKDLFFNEDEAVMQLHVAKKDWVNLHENCLHLWKPQKQSIPLPPSIMVGPKIPNNETPG